MSGRNWTMATLAAAALYIGTMAPGLTWGDSGNAQLRTFAGHYFDPGNASRSHVLFYAVTIAIAKLGLAPFQAANLVSAAAGAITVGNVAWLLTLLVRRRVAVFCGAALLLCSHSLWHLASVAEVLTFSTMLLSLELVLVVKFIGTRRNGWLIGAAFVNGLGLAAHNMSLLIWPAYFVLLAMQYGRVTRPSWRTLLWCLAALCAGASPFAALFVNTVRQGGGAGNALSQILAGRFGDYVYNTSLSIRTVAKMFAYSCYSFPSPLMVLTIPGAWALWRRESRELFWFLMMAFCGYFVFAVRYVVPDQHTFMLHSYLFMVVFVAIGIDYLQDWEGRKRSGSHGGPYTVRGFVVAVMLMVLSLTSPVVYAVVPDILRSHYPDLAPLPRRQIRHRDNFNWFLKPWHGGYNGAEQFARDTLAALPPGALLVVDSTLMPPLLYLQNAEGVRRDVEIHGAHVYQPWRAEACDIASDDGLTAVRAGRVFTVSDRREEVNFHLRDSRFTFQRVGIVFRVMLDDDN